MPPIHSVTSHYSTPTTTSSNNQQTFTRALAITTTLTTIILASKLYNLHKRYTSGSIEAASVYETKQSLYEYLLMHYGTKTDLLPTHLQAHDTPVNAIDYPRQCALTVIKLTQQPQYKHLSHSVLEIGCAVGRTAFELTAHIENVVALDYSQSFIDAANTLKQTRKYDYTRRTEGILTVPATATVSSSLHPERTHFVQGDACDLNNVQLLELNSGGKFGVILACNLLCRLPRPRKFLDNLQNLITPGGLIVFMSPYSWLDQFTPRSEWIGGYTDAQTGKELSCNDELIRLMTERGFKLIEESDMPFFIRETARKSQWTVAHKTVFQYSK